MLSHDKLTKMEERWCKIHSDLSDFTGKSLEKIKNQVLAADVDGSTLISHSYYGPGCKDRSAMIAMIEVVSTVTTDLRPQEGICL